MEENKQLKFRAWDEGNNIMHHDFHWIQSGAEGNDWICFVSDKTYSNPMDCMNNPYFRQQINIFQFTGCRDKNGKEKYEGDIIRYELQNRTFVIRFLNGAFWEECINDKNFDRSLIAADVGEVIGNICENPELLKY